MAGRPLLAVGNEARWAAIAASEGADRREREAGETVADRIERGMALSALALEIRDAAVASRAARDRPA